MKTAFISLVLSAAFAFTGMVGCASPTEGDDAADEASAGQVDEAWVVSDRRCLYNVIEPGETLPTAFGKQSCNGAFHLIVQNDGNLIIDRHGVRVWATHAFGPNHRLVMQADGNLVVYDASDTPRWASNTRGSRLYAKITDDRALVIAREGSNHVVKTIYRWGR